MSVYDFKYRYISAYRLKKEDLQECLDRFFAQNGPTEYFIEVYDTSASSSSPCWLTERLTVDRRRSIQVLDPEGLDSGEFEAKSFALRRLKQCYL